MLKKIIITALVIVLASAVGVGAYDAYQGDSTLAMPDVTAFAAGNGGFGQGNSQGQMGRGQGQGQMGQGGQGGQGQRGQGHGNGNGEPVDHEWLTLTGSVLAVEAQGLQVETAERGELLLNLGRPGFADQQNVAFTPGDSVTIDGFDSPEAQFVAGSITNDTTGQTLLLRDPNGRPLWAGPGRNGQGNGAGGGGQGQGRGNGGGQGQGRGNGGGQGQGRGSGGQSW